MKVLAISNLYPPAMLGGYELGASWVCRELARRGHEVAVCSASRYLWTYAARHVDVACPPPADLRWIDAGTAVFGADLPRLLDHGYPPSLDGLRLAVHEALVAAPGVVQQLREAVRAFAPDAIVLFNPAGLLINAWHEVQLALDTRVPTFAYVSDDWPARWPASQPLAGLAREAASGRPGLAALAALLDEHGLLPSGDAILPDEALFCSRFLRDRVGTSGLGDARATVLPWGLPSLDSIPPPAPDTFASPEPLTLAFCGQVLHHKGLAELLRALPLTRRPHRLVVIGDQTSDYGVMCQRLVEASGLGDRVTFIGKLPAEEALATLRTHAQVLVVPSLKIEGTFEEPFSIVVLQGMALGRVVIGTASGGTPEAIVDRVHGRLVDATDAAALAAVIDQVDADRDGALGMARAARGRIERAFTIETMVDALERRLTSVSAATDRTPLADITMVATYGSSDPANSGCVRVTRQLARTLAQREDVRLRIVAWDATGRRCRGLRDGERELLARYDGPPATAVAHRSAGGDLPAGGWLLLPEILEEGEAAAIRAYARRRGLHVAAVFYDAIPLTHPHLCSDVVRRRHAGYMRGLAACDRVLAISADAARELQAFWDAEGIRGPSIDVVPLAGAVGVDPSRTAEPTLRDGVAQLLCVSTLEPRKNHRRLLDALQDLPNAGADAAWSLVLVGNRYAGDEDVAPRVEQAAATDPRVTWRGVVDDDELVRLYRSSWATLYPSEVEGFGLPIVESLAHGRPVLCGNTGAIGELARGGGCLAVDVTETGSLRDGLRDLLADRELHARLAAEARDRPVRTWEAYGHDVACLLRPLPNAVGLPSRLTDTLYAGLKAEHWQMNHAERLAFLQVLAAVRPTCAIEVGTYRGGSLSAMARACGVVFSIDIDPSVAHRFADYDNVRFLTGSSQDLLPVLLRELGRMGLDPDFALIDGSHRTADVVADLVPLLDVIPRRPMTILVHDSAHPPCRQAFSLVPWDRSPYVAAVELDFVPGSAHTALTKPPEELYGGLGLIRLDPTPRSGPVVITAGAMRQ